MIKFLLYSLFLATLAGTAHSQSVIRSAGTEKSEEFKEITMSDFHYRPEYQNQTSSFAPFRLMQTKPAAALLGSALIPGLGQAANKKWIRAAAYFAADIIFVTVHIHNFNRAKELERRYKKFANENWSVVTYAQWLIEYHNQNNISNVYINELENQVEGETPAYNPETDWNVVDIELLRNVEEHTPYISPDGSGNTFSHEMPDYGSQQYYELISKYYQYGPGWNDFGVNRNGDPLDSLYQLSWDGRSMPPNFIRGAGLSERFNDKYRLAGNMVSLLLLNHLVSAFDAFATVKLKNHRLEADTNLFGPRQFILKYHF